jgi:hypothetical protein
VLTNQAATKPTNFPGVRTFSQRSIWPMLPSAWSFSPRTVSASPGTQRSGYWIPWMALPVRSTPGLEKLPGRSEVGTGRLVDQPGGDETAGRLPSGLEPLFSRPSLARARLASPARSAAGPPWRPKQVEHRSRAGRRFTASFGKTTRSLGGKLLRRSAPARHQ